MTTTPHTTSAALKDAIREAGGIVHSDGNIFFTSAEQFIKAALAASAPVAPAPQIEWDEVFDCAVYSWCRSSKSQEMLRMCFQSRNQRDQVSVGWTANELMSFAKGIVGIVTAAPKADHIPDAGEKVAPLQQGEYLPTGNPEADRVLGRLNSSDPDFDDCAEAAALIYKLVAEIKGPEGFSTWKDAAVYERGLRATLETTINTASPLAYLYTDGKHPGLDFEHAPAEDIRPGFVCIPLVAAHLAARVAAQAEPAPVAEDTARLDWLSTFSSGGVRVENSVHDKSSFSYWNPDCENKTPREAIDAARAQAAQPEGGNHG